MRLIDADALLEELKKTYKYFDLKFYIEDAPTIKPSGDSGVFIPDISVEQLRNAPLEGVEELLAEGVMRDVLEPSKSTDQKSADVPSGDLISRQWLLDLYDIDTTSFKETAKVPLEVIIQNIKDAPSVSIQPKTIANDCDLISRADAIEAVQKDIEFEKEHAIPYEDYDSGCIGGLKKAIRTLNALPSADRPHGEDWDKYSEELWHLAYERGQNDRPKGEWIRKEDNVSWWVECSKCGEKPLLDVYSHTYEKTPYCPHCGADMRKE